MARRARRWLFFTAGAAVLLVALYAALGYLVAPSLIRNALVERAAQAGLDLRLGAIAMHPFTGALDARDVELATRAGERLANAGRVTVELQFASLWRSAWLLSRVALEEPALYALPVTRRAAGQTAQKMPPVVVRELAVERGVLALPSLPRLEALQVSVRDLATLPGHDNAYNASAAIASGGSAQSQGRLSLAPFEASGELEIKQGALAEVWRRLASGSGDLPAGEITGSLHYRYADGRLALSQVNAEAGLRSGGALALRGTVATSPLEGELQVSAKDVPLALAQPWVKTAVRIRAGTLAGQGSLRLGAKPYLEGSAAIRDARLDGPQGELVGWHSLAGANLRLDFAPFAAHVRELVVQGPFVHVVIGPQGELNLARAFAGGEPAAKKAEPPTVSVDRLTVQAGELRFEDRSLQTPFATTVQDLAGAITGLATGRDSAAQVALTGRVGKYGEARVSGALEPVAPATRTNLRLRLSNLSLADFTPYAVKFAGYRIESGRLTADLRYRVREGRLVGSNQLEFDQLKLGEKVASAGALDLPVDLAVALLTDAQGRINLAIPVSGDLRDPQFDLGGLIAKALRNTLAKVVSAPFRWLASVFGGEAGESNAGNVSFTAGSATLTPPQQEKLAGIARALAERPQLRVSIRGGYDPQADAQALKRAALLQELAKRAGYSAAAAGGSAPVDARDPRIRRAAEELYLERGGLSLELSQLKPREPGYGQRLIAALASHTDLPADALENLAARRAQAVRAALTAAGVDAGRCDIGASATVDAKSGPVTTALQLHT